MSLRDEVRDYGALEGARACSWRRARERWADYIEDRREVEGVVFENEDGDRAIGSDVHRFAPEYADKQYAKLKDLERGLADDYGRRLHTAMLTLTASSEPDGTPLPPVDHLDGLLSSWDAVRRALSRSLDGRRWEYLAILEPHRSGYVHVHVAVFVEGRVTRSDLAPAIEAHVRNCDLAEWDAHDLEDDSTISVRHAGADRDLEDDDALDELACYLAEYLGAYGEDPLDQPEHVQASNALLWATGRQRWRPSNGAQQYMVADVEDDQDSDWWLVGVQRDGELLEVDPDVGGVDRFETSKEPPP